jgi:hypothetical protein
METIIFVVFINCCILFSSKSFQSGSQHCPWSWMLKKLLRNVFKIVTKGQEAHVKVPYSFLQVVNNFFPLTVILFLSVFKFS